MHQQSKSWISLILSLNLIACQTIPQSATKSAYNSSRQAFEKGDIEGAQKAHPASEADTFIPTLEQAWLSLLTGQVDTEKLVEWSQYLEDSKVVHLENEASRFFYKELDEYYVPGEHEIVMFHLIAGLGFAKAGQDEAVCVEAKRAGYYLPGPFVEKKHFDDAGIRMILSALWMICGEWQQARANLLKASKLSNDFTWAKKMAQRPKAPENFVIAFAGVGPEVFWRPEHKNSEKWGLVFLDKTGKPLTLNTKNGPIKLGKPSSSKHWYTRHFYRDSMPREIIDNAERVVKIAVGTALGLGAAAFVIAGGLVVFAGSIAVSAGVVALGVAAESSELVEVGLKLSILIIPASFAIAGEAFEYGTGFAEQSYDEAADQSESYRFVRFLPSHIYARPIKGPLKAPQLGKFKPLIDHQGKDSRILIFHKP